MAPGIFRLRTACCTLVVPIRLAICLPLLICILDAYSPHAALVPQSAPPSPLILNITRPLPGPGPGPGPAGVSPPSPEDTHVGGGIPAYEYTATLRPGPSPPPAPSAHHLGRALTLSFVLAAAAHSVLGIIAFWWLGDLAAAGAAGCGGGGSGSGDASEDDAAMLVEGGAGAGESGCRKARRRLQLSVLFLGTVTRLLLGGLGTTAMARVIGDRSALKRGSFIAVEVLGWLLVAVLYCGAFHRMHCLLRHGSFEALQARGGRKEVLTGGLVGKRGHDGTLS